MHLRRNHSSAIPQNLTPLPTVHYMCTSITDAIISHSQHFWHTSNLQCGWGEGRGFQSVSHYIKSFKVMRWVRTLEHLSLYARTNFPGKTRIPMSPLQYKTKLGRDEQMANVLLLCEHWGHFPAYQLPQKKQAKRKSLRRGPTSHKPLWHETLHRNIDYIGSWGSDSRAARQMLRWTPLVFVQEQHGHMTWLIPCLWSHDSRTCPGMVEAAETTKNGFHTMAGKD